MEQLPVQRKMLNLKRSHRAHPGKIWAVVECWTTQGPRAGFDRLGKTRTDPGESHVGWFGPLAGSKKVTVENAGPEQRTIRSRSIGPVIASGPIVALLKIHRTMDRTVVFTVSGRLDAENVSELCQLIDAEPAGAVVVVDFTDLVLADRDAIHYLRDCETGDRIVLRNCPAYIRAWMAAQEND